jgi:hypothetical protein
MTGKLSDVRKQGVWSPTEKEKHNFGRRFHTGRNMAELCFSVVMKEGGFNPTKQRNHNVERQGQSGLNPIRRI